jgi:hypothetical protein
MRVIDQIHHAHGAPPVKRAESLPDEMDEMEPAGVN